MLRISTVSTEELEKSMQNGNLNKRKTLRMQPKSDEIFEHISKEDIKKLNELK